MKIVDTFILKIPVVNKFVKVYRGRGKQNQQLYFMEIEPGELWEITEIYFNLLLEI